MYVGGFFEGVDFATAASARPVTGLCIGDLVWRSWSRLRCSCPVSSRRSRVLWRASSEGRALDGRRDRILRSGMELGRPVPSSAGNGRVCERRTERAWRGAYPSAHAIIFLVAAFIGFAMGTSWGTIALILPIVIGVPPPTTRCSSWPSARRCRSGGALHLADIRYDDPSPLRAQSATTCATLPRRFPTRRSL